MKLRQSKHTSLNICSSFRDKRRLVFATMLLGAGVAAFVCPIPKFYNQGVQAEGAASDPTISISASGLVGLSPTAGGVASEGYVDITSSTTNYTGYYLSLTSSDGKMTILDYGSGDSLSGQTIDSLTSSTDANSSDFINKWGYRVGGSGNYDAIPTTLVTGNLVDSDSATTDTTSLYLAARVGQTKAQGAYVGELTLTATVNPNKAYSITYNTTGSVSGMPSNVETTTENTTVDLSSASPSRTNYNFVEWCTVSVADNASCSGTSYDPGDTITLDPTTANAIMLYAVWLFKPTVTFTVNNSSYGSVSSSSVVSVYGATVSINGNVATVGSTSITATASSGYEFDSWTNNCGDTLTTNCTITANFKKPNLFDAQFAAAGKSKDADSGLYKMQDMTSTICSNVTTPTTTTEEISTQLIDSRDSKIYWVTKLLDGNCWMTQNLDLNITTAGLNSETSDLGYSNGSYPSTTKYWNSSSTYPPTATVTAASSSSTITATLSWDLGDYYWTPTSNTSWTSCGTSAKSYANCTSYGFSTTKPTTDGAGNTIDGDHYQVGTLYQWNTATAGSGGTITSADATDSICPKGWRLPTSNSTTNDYSFGKLLTAYGYSSWSDKKVIQNTPLFFVPGGYVYSGTLRSAGNLGLYWSSMAYSITSVAYYLLFGSSLVYPSDSNVRYYGFSVRCVAR